MNLNSFLKEVFTGDNIKDYSHASKAFRSDTFRLSPKYAFLYFVRITLDVSVSNLPDGRRQEIGVLCKSVGLPKFSFDTKTLNAYNRNNIVQTKIKYDPIEFKFHDDTDNVIRDFWYDYYSYYYRDSDHMPADYNQPHKYSQRTPDYWGYSPNEIVNDSGGGTSSSGNIIKEISIFSFHQKRFSEYVLYNPTITAFRHGEHSAAGDTGTMEHSMTVAYEAVKYRKGFVTKNNFADMLLHYDNSPSPLSPAGGGTASILGPGGALNTADEVIADLAAGNFGAALFKGGRGLKNFSGKDLGALAKGELFEVGKDILRGGNPLSKLNIPSISNLIGGGGTNGVTGGIGSVFAAGGVAAAGLAASATTAVTSFFSGRKSQQPTPAIPNNKVTSNGDTVGVAGNPIDTPKIPFPSLPSATSAINTATKFADGAPVLNDAREVLAGTAQNRGGYGQFV